LARPLLAHRGLPTGTAAKGEREGTREGGGGGREREAETEREIQTLTR
jgi:hypothetical protein